MHNLLVAPRPATTPPFGVVVVRAPGSPHPQPDGCVLIEHLSDTGHNDRIERRADQAFRCSGASWFRREPIAVVRTDLDTVLDRRLTWPSVFDRILIHIRYRYAALP
jgi:hypothetical protein